MDHRGSCKRRLLADRDEEGLPRQISAPPAGQGEVPGTEAFHYWNVRIHAGAARRTLYTAWLRESPPEVDRLLHEQREREAFRRSLPHHERKRPPWGRL